MRAGGNRPFPCSRGKREIAEFADGKGLRAATPRGTGGRLASTIGGGLQPANLETAKLTVKPVRRETVLLQQSEKRRQ